MDCTSCFSQHLSFLPFLAVLPGDTHWLPPPTFHSHHIAPKGCSPVTTLINVYSSVSHSLTFWWPPDSTFFTKSNRHVSAVLLAAFDMADHCLHLRNLSPQLQCDRAPAFLPPLWHFSSNSLVSSSGKDYFSAFSPSFLLFLPKSGTFPPWHLAHLNSHLQADDHQNSIFSSLISLDSRIHVLTSKSFYWICLWRFKNSICFKFKPFSQVCSSLLSVWSSQWMAFNVPNCLSQKPESHFPRPLSLPTHTNHLLPVLPSFAWVHVSSSLH